MNKDAFIKTSMCYWSESDGCYVVESPLFDRTIGVGPSPEEAKQHYVEMLDDTIEFLQGGKIYERPGRPLKGNTDFHTKVKPAVKKAIEQIGIKYGGISNGEVLDYLVFYHDTISTRFKLIDNKPLVEFRSAKLRTDQGCAETPKPSRNVNLFVVPPVAV